MTKYYDTKSNLRLQVTNLASVDPPATRYQKRAKYGRCVGRAAATGLGCLPWVLAGLVSLFILAAGLAMIGAG